MSSNGQLTSALSQHQANGSTSAAAPNGPVYRNVDATTVPTGPPLANLLSELEDYLPTIPDAITKHYLTTAGVHTDDPRIVRLVSLAGQKFICEIANDALQHSKMRVAAGPQTNKNRKCTMTTEDLSLALADQGITLKKPPYYV